MAKKRIIISLCSVFGAVILIVLSYVLYVMIAYYRVEDKLALSVSGNVNEAVPTQTELSLVTYNIGFGAYSDDYSFFMDGGKYSRGFSREAVLNNIQGMLKILKNENPDFILLHEVDIKGTRSYDVNQAEIMANGLIGYENVFAQNYDSPYLFYPFNSPIGANKSGIMSFSRYHIDSAMRRSLPIEESFYKFLDLDRAYSISRISVANGKTLVLYNVHLSAYTSDSSIADEQLKMLCFDMASEYEKGNYVIAAGDFNKDLLGDSSKYFEREGNGDDFTWAKPIDESILPEGICLHTGSNLPTCRNADSPFRNDGTDFVLSVDGVLVSDNIEVTDCETLNVNFIYSDHNPVNMSFILK